MFLRRLLALIFVLTPVTWGMADTDADSWPQWRGPLRDGTVPGANWPDNLRDPSFQKLWRIDDLGPSYSGPIVSGNRVFITETVDKKTEVVRCLERSTGKEIWRKEWPGSLSVFFIAIRNGDWIRSTPAFDGEALYVGGIRDVLVCLEAKDGKERWRLDFPTEFKSGLPAFGCVCSPLVDDKAVYVQFASSFAAVDKKSGKVLWRILKEAPGPYGSPFASPTLATIAGKEQLLVQMRTKLSGVEKNTGDVLWTRPIPADKGMNILTPVQKDDTIFTSSYGGGSRLIQVKKTDDKWDTSEVWAAKYQGYMTSPVLVDGHVYFFGKDRQMVCMELATGKICWQTRKSFGEYWSMVVQKDKILALDMNGKLYLVKANPKEYEELDVREVAKSETWAHLAVSGDQIFVRDLTGITSYRWSKSSK